MLQVLKSILAPMTSLVILVMGSGLFLTYTTLRLKLGGFNNLIVGIVTAAYYAGLFLGSFKAERFIERIGHIRAFSTFAALTAVATMGQGYLITWWSWIFFRFVAGVCMAGLFIAIESWLLFRSDNKTRGKILSIYMCCFYGAQGLGQFFLDIADPLSIIPYTIAVTFAALSIVPVAVTRTIAPTIEESSYLNIIQLSKISPLGVTGSILSGMLLSVMYGLTPIYAQGVGMTTGQIANLMSAMIFGGLFFQWPIGTLSDYVDRRKVIFVSSLLSVILALVIAYFNNSYPYLLLALMAVFGGCTFALYPLSISHTCDNINPKDIVGATGGLLLAYGVGAIVGPLIGPFSISYIGYYGLFVFYAIIVGILTIYTLYRLISGKAVPPEEKLPYANTPRTTPVASELDPRQNENDEEKKQ